MRTSRLSDRIDPASARVAVRAAVLMPACFFLAGQLFGSGSQVFASFGAFILLAMTTFAGRPRPRLLAWAGLVATGCLFITLGTLLSHFTVVAALAAGLLSFAVFFSGVINPYFAAARNGAVLLIALPLMVEADPSMIGDRLLGWLLACSICIPATWLIWRLPWLDDLHEQSSRTARALAALIREPASGERQRAASQEVWQLRRRFLASPNRPTGVTGVSAAVARLVDELGWTFGLLNNQGPGVNAGRAVARELRREMADLLDACAGVLLGSGQGLRLERVERPLDELEDRSIEALASGIRGESRAETLRDLDQDFRLRKLAFSVLEIGRATGEIARRKAAAPAGRSALESVRQALAAAGRVVRQHARIESSWMRNSIRGGLGIGLAVLVADLVSAQNAFWVVLGTLSILRSNALGTRSSVVQALAGTLAGIVVGSLIVIAVGEDRAFLWVALPCAVFAAAYGQRAVSFAAGQAGFAMLVMVLYNLIEPAGWQVGLVRIEDVAIGCAVSLVVGLLIWPRGAAELIRRSLAGALRANSDLVRDRAKAVLEGRTATRSDRLFSDAVASSELLDAALRRYLDESAGEHIDRESLMALSAAGMRLRRTAHGLARMPRQPWYRVPGPDGTLTGMIDRTCDSYADLGEAILTGSELPATPALGDAGWLLDGLAGDSGRETGAHLARIWLFENLVYLTELHHRYAGRARMLFAVSSENPPPTGDIPLPRPAAVR